MKRLKKSLNEEEVKRIFSQIEDTLAFSGPVTRKLLLDIQAALYEEVPDPKVKMKLKRRGHTTHLCDFRQPPGEKECLEAVWSEGRACKRCYRDDCYRHGWAKDAVDSDNRRWCREKGWRNETE